MGQEFTKLNKNIVEMTKQLQNSVSSLGRNVGAQIGGILSDEMKETAEITRQGFSFLKQGGLASLDFMKKSFLLGGLRFKWQQKNYKMLETQVKLMKSERKSRLATFKGKRKGGGWGWLLWLLGISLGWLTKSKLALTGIFRFFKSLIPLKKIIDGLKLPKFTFLKKLGLWFRGLPKLPGAKFLLRLTRGLGRLALFLTALFGVIDFINGFWKTHGSTFEKVKGGLKNAVQSFLDDTVGFVGDALDWVLSKFGINTKIGPSVKELIDKGTSIGVALWHAILNPWGGGIDSLLAELSLTQKGDINSWIESVRNKITKLPGLILAWLQDLPGIKFVSGIYDFLKGGESGGGGQVVRGKINDTRFDDMWQKWSNAEVDSTTAKYHRAKMEQAMQTNTYLKELVKVTTNAKTEGQIVTVPIPARQQQPVSQIPDNTGDGNIENLTRQGYTY